MSTRETANPDASVIEGPIKVECRWEEDFNRNLWYGRVYVEAIGDVPRLLPLKPSLEVFNHSPGGFAWGYGGSGPSQLALAILLHVTRGDHEVTEHHQDFKREFIEPLPSGGSAEFEVDVMDWLWNRGFGA